MNVPGADDGARLTWLARHRLWPVVGFLAQRGDLTERLSTLAEPLARRQRAAMRAQTDEDRRVVNDLVASGASILVLKGALLAQTVYPTPECRFRTDLDLLADPDHVPAVEGRLRCLGYYPPEGAQSAMPMRQSQWTRSVEDRFFSVDLHWDLRNHPALQGRFGFSELLASSQPLPGLCEQALGLGFPHALLNASMHYFNDYADERPQQWLLDKDLLWRAMTPEQRQQTSELACEKGLAGLLAESLNLARDAFGTPVDEAAISRLRQAGQHEWTTGLVKANRKRVTAYWFALRSEPGLSRKFKRIMTGLFPPSSYVRKLYPEGSRFGLVGLYVRRIAGSMKQSHR